MKVALKKEERLSVVRNSRELVWNGITHYMCEAIEETIYQMFPNDWALHNTDSVELFPELLLFKPKRARPDGAWWRRNGFNKYRRIIILMLVQLLIRIKKTE